MAKKIKIYLTYQKKDLWWSTDKDNWGIVSAKSPQSVLGKNSQITWVAYDSSIDDITVDLDNDEIIDTPLIGDKKEKTGKVKSNAIKGAQTKYTINVIPAGETAAISVDPDLKYCDPECPPG